MTGANNTATIRGGLFVPPPGWARPTDRIVARLRARVIDDMLLNGGATNGSAVVIVRRARLLNRRYRSGLARALRKLVEAASHADIAACSSSRCAALPCAALPRFLR